MAGLDAKQVSTAQWLGIGAGLLTFINSFLPWYSVSIEMGAMSQSESGGAWSVGFLAWFAVLLLIGAGVIAALPLFGKPVNNGTIIWLALSGLAVVLIVIRWLTYDAAADVPAAVEEMAGVEYGASFGTFLGLILAVVSLVGAVLARKSTSAPSAPNAA